MKQNQEVHSRNIDELEETLGDTMRLKEQLIKDLRSQAELAKNSHLAFTVQSELVNTKEELIKNQKMLIDTMKVITPESNFHEDGELKPGVVNCIEFLKCQAVNGVLLNGLLIWIWIQRRTTAENIWMSEAISKFTKEEITVAKEELWKIAGESVIGRMVKRQGSSKSTTEIDDICSAMKILSENGSLPMFIGTSEMIIQTPIYNIDSEKSDNRIIANRLKVIQETVSSLVEITKQNGCKQIPKINL